MKTQLGYQKTISEKNVQALTMLNDRILSIYKKSGLYCLGTTKLVATSSSFFSNCFENENTLGTKVSNIYLGKKHQSIFLIAENKISSYKMSPITFKIKYRTSLEDLHQQIIQSKMFNNKLYVLTQNEKQNNGVLYIYSIDKDSNLHQVDKHNFNYTPKKFKITNDSEWIYIEAKNSIHKYYTKADGSILKSEKIITLKTNTSINDFDIQKHDRGYYIVIGYKETDENFNTERGYISVYNDSESATTMLNNYEDRVPTKIVIHSGLIVISYYRSFTVMDFDNGRLMQKTAREIDTNETTSQIITQKGQMFAIVTNDYIYILQLTNVIADITLKQKSHNSIFAKNSHFLVGHENSIDIFEISMMI